jgi:hypothetical protein
MSQTQAGCDPEFGRRNENVHLAHSETERAQGFIEQIGNHPVQHPEPQTDTIAGDDVDRVASLLMPHLVLPMYLYMQFQKKSRFKYLVANWHEIRLRGTSAGFPGGLGCH